MHCTYMFPDEITCSLNLLIFITQSETGTYTTTSISEKLIQVQFLKHELIYFTSSFLLCQFLWFCPVSGKIDRFAVLAYCQKDASDHETDEETLLSFFEVCNFIALILISIYLILIPILHYLCSFQALVNGNDLDKNHELRELDISLSLRQLCIDSIKLVHLLTRLEERLGITEDDTKIVFEFVFHHLDDVLSQLPKVYSSFKRQHRQLSGKRRWSDVEMFKNDLFILL